MDLLPRRWIVYLNRNVIVVVACLSIAGCAHTLSENQCRANDWYTVGFADGSNGYDVSRLLQHADACVGHSVMPDRAQYTAGWNAGIAQYCTPENGFDLGARGASYSRICPAAAEAQFHAAYSDGRTLYAAQSEVDQIENAIDQRAARIDNAQRELQSAVDAMIAPETPATDRLFLLERTKSLAEEQGRLHAEIERLEADLVVKRARVETLRHELAYAS